MDLLTRIEKNNVKSLLSDYEVLFIIYNFNK